MFRFLLVLCLLLILPLELMAQDTDAINRLKALPIQHQGRIMPLDSYARGLAVQLTGRIRWSDDRGPAAYSGREPIELLCEMVFRPQSLMSQELIAIENRPFKELIGLEATRRFFTPWEIASCQGVNEQLMEFSRMREQDPEASPLPDQKRALDLSAALDRLASFSAGAPLALIPTTADAEFVSVGPTGGDPGTESVQTALASLRDAYLADQPLGPAVDAVVSSIASVGVLDARSQRRVDLEVFYNGHRPWLRTSVAYGLAIIAFGLSRLVFRKPLVIIAVVLGLLGVLEHVLGISLRVAILGRAPVSNTFEALLWMGLIGIGVGLVAQLLDRKSWYLFGGVCAALLSVLFAGLVPLSDQTNTLPAVLRSNYWLIVHVLTIVASYGVLAVASVLGHVYLAQFLLPKRSQKTTHASEASPPLVVQTYRCIQVGLLLLTAGTILGGVWAADSWGRFWGWDPKETWALISIVIYFAILHARYIHWLGDFGLAAAAVLGFAAIVWTFYGVNYVMATGLHSYGFGSGGEVWVMAWAGAEAIFLIVCRWRFNAGRPRGGKGGETDAVSFGGTEPQPQ